MPKLTINTQKSLYSPIEVEVNGKIFQVRRLTRSILQEVARLDTEVSSGKLDMAYERLEILLHAKSKAFDSLVIEEVGEITEFIIKSVFSPEKSEKNESRPEGEKSPK